MMNLDKSLQKGTLVGAGGVCAGLLISSGLIFFSNYCLKKSLLQPSYPNQTEIYSVAGERAMRQFEREKTQRAYEKSQASYEERKRC